MARLAGQGGEPLPHGAVEPLNEGGVEHTASIGALQQSLRRLKGAMGHLARDLAHPFFNRVLDDRANV